MVDFAATADLSLREIVDLYLQYTTRQMLKLSKSIFYYDKTLDSVFRYPPEELSSQSMLLLRIMTFLDIHNIAEEMLVRLGNQDSSGILPLWTNQEE